MRSIHLLPALLLLAAPAAAQGTIRPGQSVTGELAVSDPVLDGGSHFDLWRFRGQAEHTYRVTLRSEDFDAYLVVGSDAGGECGDCAHNDDSGGGTDASLEFTSAADGTYMIRANAFDEEELGRYELILEDEGTQPEHREHESAAVTGIPISLGQTVQGELARGDAKDYGSSYSDTYTYQGRAGETLVITLASEDFDAQLDFGQVTNGECMELDHDDDGGEGTNSRLAVTLPEDGAYHVHVGSAEAGQRGRYTLLVERGPAVAEVPPADTMEYMTFTLNTIVADQPVEGRLEQGDSRASDESYFDGWSYSGEAGETITIRMQSEDFDTYLAFGRLREDGGWEEMQTNDDGPDGTNSELTVTLPEAGSYVIRANAFSAGHTGLYTLSVERN